MTLGGVSGPELPQGATNKPSRYGIRLNDIFGGPALTARCHLSQHGIQFKLNALIDSGAGGEAFIHPKLLPAIKKYFKVQILQIKHGGVSVSGFNNKHADIIRDVFKLDLLVAGRRTTTWFLVCNTGKHDILLGRIWLAKNRALVDCEDQIIRWKDEQQDLITGVPAGLTVPTSEIKRSQQPQIDQDHQQDANRRDALMEQQIRKGQIKILRRLTPTPTPAPQGDKRGCHPRTAPRDLPTHASNLQESYNRMDKELKADPEQSTKLSRMQKRTNPHPDQAAREADIALVSAEGFLINARRKNVILGATSLYEVNKLIKDHEQADDPQESPEIERLLNERLPSYLQAAYRDAFSKVKADELPPHRPGADHDIQLEGENTLARSPLYNMSIEQLGLMKEYLEEHLKKGFIVPSGAPFSSPVLFAKKPGGGWRFCVDYRKLNAITKKDQYPIPLIEETLARLSKARIFTKLDVRHAFNRIRLNEDIEDLTTFRTRYGSYKYRVMPFGLCNGPASFQRFINSVLFDYIDDFCTAYIDDILIYSEDPLEHEEHVRKVLDRLRQAGLPVDVKKSEFSVTSTKYLGFIISTKGIAMDPDKVAIIKDWEVPTSLRGLQSFLGFCNFYRRFLKDYGRVVRPLTRLTAKDRWHPLEEPEIKAFNKTKELVLNGGLIAHYSPHRPTRMETDSSDGVSAGVLSQQQHDGEWKPVAFFSKVMNPEEMRYEIHDKEMLAIMRGLAEWRPLLIGLQNTPFLAITDHRALEYFTTKRLLNPRQARWADQLAEYHLKITYRPGSINTIADILSRKAEVLKTQKEKDIAARTTVLIKPLMIATLEDSAPAPAPTDEALDPQQAPQPEPTGTDTLELIDQVLKANREHDSLQKYRDLAGRNGWEMKQGLLLYFGKLVVPDVDHLRTKLIHEAHATRTTAHPGKAKPASC